MKIETQNNPNANKQENLHPGRQIGRHTGIQAL